MRSRSAGRWSFGGEIVEVVAGARTERVAEERRIGRVGGAVEHRRAGVATEQVDAPGAHVDADVVGVVEVLRANDAETLAQHQQLVLSLALPAPIDD